MSFLKISTEVAGPLAALFAVSFVLLISLVLSLIAKSHEKKSKSDSQQSDLTEAAEMPENEAQPFSSSAESPALPCTEHPEMLPASAERRTLPEAEKAAALPPAQPALPADEKTRQDGDEHTVGTEK